MIFILALVQLERHGGQGVGILPLLSFSLKEDPNMTTTSFEYKHFRNLVKARPRLIHDVWINYLFFHIRSVNEKPVYQ